MAGQTRQAFFLLLVLLAASAAAWLAGQVPQAPTPPTTGTGFIAGQVVDVPSGRPIPEATVTIFGRSAGAAAAGRGAPAPPAVIADAQGRFFFVNLPAGSYMVQASKAGYVPARALAVELAGGQRVLDGRIRLAKFASLSGTLRDEAGDPVVGTDVIVFRRFSFNGRPSLAPIGKSRSDDRGMYRASNLPAGDYVVCACSRDSIPFDGLLLTTLASEPLQLMNVAARALTLGSDAVSLDNTLRAYPPTLYQNSQTLARATRVTLAPGDEKTGIDITLDFVRATRVSGTVVGAPGPIQASLMRLVPAVDAEAGIELLSLQPMLVQPDGRFDFATVPPGQYRLFVAYMGTGGRAPGPSGVALSFAGSRGAMPPPAGPALSAGGAATSPEPILWASEPVSVGADGISGRVEFIGSAPQPPVQMLSRVAFLFEPMGFDRGPTGGVSIGRLNADATIVAAGVVPGKYALNPTGLPGFTTLKSITVAGVDVTDLPFEVGERDISDVVITFVDTPMATLTVTVTAAATVTAPGSAAIDDTWAMVFPVDRKYWTDPAAARRRFRSVAVTTTGTAIVPDLPAGDYVVLVGTGQDTVDWQEPAKLETLSRRAQRVTLTDGGKASIGVRR